MFLSVWQVWLYRTGAAIVKTKMRLETNGGTLSGQCSLTNETTETVCSNKYSGGVLCVTNDYRSIKFIDSTFINLKPESTMAPKKGAGGAKGGTDKRDDQKKEKGESGGTAVKVCVRSSL